MLTTVKQAAAQPFRQPISLPPSDPAAALAIATGDAGAREMGWSRLETAPIAGLDASETDRMEPTVARRG